MSETYSGGCMCGQVTFRFAKNVRFVADCVCDSCRRAHGAAVVTWVGVKTDQFTLESGEADLTWYRSSAASERGFCQQCGTRLFFRSSKWPGEMHMAVACVHPPHELRSRGLSFDQEYPAWTAVTPPRA